jgi:cytochrome P450
MQFGPKQIRLLQTAIRGIVSEILDEIEDTSRVNLMQEICWKLPARTYCHLVAVPTDQAATVARFSDSILGPLFNSDTDRRDEHIAAFQEALTWITAQIAAKRGSVGEDFISALIEQERDGQISEEEVVQQALTVLIGSVDNTMNQAGLILGTLLEDPARWEGLTRDLDLVPTAVEESIRFRPRFGTIFRQATSRVDLNGVTVEEGAFVFVSVRAAQRDPRAFAEPDRFVIERPPSEPLMFGNGPYRCLGQHLARLEFTELLRGLVERYPNTKLAEPWHRRDSDAVTEVDTLWATLSGV